METNNTAVPSPNGDNGAHYYKITEEQFHETLIENQGKFARTAEAIKAKYGVHYSRQAVRERAQKYEEELRQFEIDFIELAEEALKQVMQDEDNPMARVKAATFVIANLCLKRAGKTVTGNKPATNSNNTQEGYGIGGKIIVPGGN
jgi:hypothetical protein